MKLTEKCKIDFEKWFCLNDNVNEDYYVDSATKFIEYRCIHFTELPPSMKYGVYVDFFDTITKTNSNWTMGEEIVYDVYYNFEYEGMSIKEAREQAILKANEIYNERE